MKEKTVVFAPISERRRKTISTRTAISKRTKQQSSFQKFYMQPKEKRGGFGFGIQSLVDLNGVLGIFALF